MKSGDTFAGVVFDADRQSVVLREVQAFGAGQQGKNVPVDGEVLLFAEDIAYTQFP